MSEVVSLLQDLVHEDTTNPPGNEGKVAQVLSGWLKAKGIDDIEVDEVEPGRLNLLARVEGERPGPTLVLNTHMDVVPAGQGWERDAFSGDVQDGVVIGRGAADSKGSLAAMAVAVERLSHAKHDLCGRVLLAAVCDEEVGSLGARHLLEQTTADAAIVGEPTNLRLMSAHKGSIRPVIKVTGKAAHAAQPHKGVNAAVGMARLITMLEENAKGLVEKKHELLGSPTFVPVRVDAGEALNMVPEEARVTIDRRLVPGETEEAVLDTIGEWLQQFERENPGFTAGIIECAPTTGGPSETPGDDTFVETARNAMKELGCSAELYGLQVNCDMTHFRQKNISTLVCGPGSPDVMHVSNENVDIGELERAVDVYTEIARSYLESGE